MTSLRSWLLLAQIIALAGCVAPSTDNDASTADVGVLEPCTMPGTYDVYVVNLVNECGETGPVDIPIPIDIPPSMSPGPVGCVFLDWMQTGACSWRWRTRCTGDFQPMPPIELAIEMEARGGRIEGTFTGSRADESGAVCHSSGALATRDE